MRKRCALPLCCCVLTQLSQAAQLRLRGARAHVLRTLGSAKVQSVMESSSAWSSSRLRISKVQCCSWCYHLNWTWSSWPPPRTANQFSSNGRRQQHPVAKPVSAKALGLLVLGTKGIEDSTVQAQSLQFMAQIAATSEPMLLAATLYQIGDGWVATP